MGAEIDYTLLPGIALVWHTLAEARAMRPTR
jgi:hypothetical protein